MLTGYILNTLLNVKEPRCFLTQQTVVLKCKMEVLKCELCLCDEDYSREAFVLSTRDSCWPVRIYCLEVCQLCSICWQILTAGSLIWQAFPHQSPPFFFLFFCSKNCCLINMSLRFSPTQAVVVKTRKAVRRVSDERACVERLQWFVVQLREAARHTLRLMTNQSVKLPLSFIMAMRLTGQRWGVAMETGLMAVPSEQMEVKKLFGTSEGGAILAIGGRGSCCLSTSFGASAAI